MLEQSMKTVTNVPGLKCYQCARLQKPKPQNMRCTAYSAVWAYIPDVHTIGLEQQARPLRHKPGAQRDVQGIHQRRQFSIVGRFRR